MEKSRRSHTLKLYQWNPGSTLAPFIIPVRSNETPAQAGSRYLRNLWRNEGLMSLFDHHLPKTPLRGFKLLSPVSRHRRVLLIANLAKDYTKTSPRLIQFTKTFTEAQQDCFILPICADLGLTREEAHEFRSLIASEFPFLVAMGGDDVEPSLYSGEKPLCRDTSLCRDASELALIKSYIEHGTGFLLGVCRGSQISSVALGYKLIEDVPSLIGENIAHSNHWHDIEVRGTSHNILKSVEDGASCFYVNSLHHQSVLFIDGGPLELAAYAPDGVIEATEFKNGRGLLLQFHPELMNNHLGKRILFQAVVQKDSLLLEKRRKTAL